MKIAAGINTFANPLGLEACLASLTGGVDAQLVIHGRYPNFPVQHASDLFQNENNLQRISKYSINST